MADNYRILKSNFKPFSYQEIIAPLADYQKAYNTLVDSYDTLSLNSSDIGTKLNSDKDKELLKQYKNYETELNAAMDDLYNNGLNAGSRKRLSKLKSQYASVINPIEEAYKKYSTAQSKLAELSITHPEIITEGYGNSVSDFMYGNTPKSNSLSLNDLENKAAKLGEIISNNMFNIEGPWEKSNVAGIMRKKTSRGISDSDFNSYLNEIRNYNEETDTLSEPAKQIYDSIKSIYGEYGVDNFKDEHNRERILNSLESGLRKGLRYTEDIKEMEDPSMRRAIQQEQLKAAKIQNEIRELGIKRDDEGNIIDIIKPEDKTNNPGSPSSKTTKAGILKTPRTMEISFGKDNSLSFTVSDTLKSSSGGILFGEPITYDKLLNVFGEGDQRGKDLQKAVDEQIGEHNSDYYVFYMDYSTKKKPKLRIEPRYQTTVNQEDSFDTNNLGTQIP